MISLSLGFGETPDSSLILSALTLVGTGRDAQSLQVVAEDCAPHMGSIATVGRVLSLLLNGDESLKFPTWPSLAPPGKVVMEYC